MSAKTKQRLAIAVGLVVVVAALLWLFVLRKPAAEQLAMAPPGGAPPAAAPPAPAAPAPAAPPAPEAVPSPPPTPAGPQPDPYRPDPFAELYPPRPPQPPPPVPPPLAIEEVGALPVASNLLPPIPINIAQAAMDRVAGVLWNDHVWAILERNNVPSVVQPGDVLNGDTVRAISPRGVILASESGRQTEVRLQGSVGGTQGPSPVGAPLGRPSLPGMAPAEPY